MSTCKLGTSVSVTAIADVASPGVPTRKPRILVTFAPEDLEAFAAIKAKVHGMTRNGIIVAAARLGLPALKADPSLAATAPPGGAQPKAKRKWRASD